MRIWLSGPRLFGGLVRPGISFALSELRKKPSRAKRRAEPDDPELAENLRNADEHPARLPLRIKVAVFLIWAFAVYGFICAVVSIAHAGTCRYYMDGAYAVTSCEDGSYTVRDRDGHVRQYGERNGGFERFPGQGERPVIERRGRD
ncbi:MAG TPA: hypothetical protein VH157_16820 [Bryobacteraceae bacterium]|jgi:hypothetical protein|nr:hypothetical protein [Bryobacteraceae bacterium]